MFVEFQREFDVPGLVSNFAVRRADTSNSRLFADYSNRVAVVAEQPVKSKLGGGAFTPPLTKGALRPLWKPQRADSFIPAASGRGFLSRSNKARPEFAARPVSETVVTEK